MTTVRDVSRLVLEVRHLKLLLAIYETGSVTAAAKALHLTQPALSQQLRQIEEQLGIDLFHRVRRKMVLTPAGQTALETAARVLSDLKNTESHLRNVASGTHGVIRISTECYTCYFWLPAVLRQFQKRYPGIEVYVDVAATPNPLPRLLRRDLDLGVVSSEPHDSAIRFDPLFEDEMVVVIWRGHRLEKKRFIDPQDLAGENVLIYPPREESFLLRKVMHNVEPGRVIELPHTEAIIEMIRSQMGVSFMAAWVVHPYLRNGSLVGKRVTRNGFRRTWRAATLAEYNKTPAMNELISLIRKARPM
jgi:LysR family transcriptional regulator for metE and metH